MPSLISEDFLKQSIFLMPALYPVSPSWTNQPDYLRDSFSSSLTHRGNDDAEKIHQIHCREGRSRYTPSDPSGHHQPRGVIHEQADQTAQSGPLVALG
jgi:hypothetical protein